MPSATGVVQEAGVPGRPAISTRHSRQEPNAASESVEQSLGTWMPATTAARITDVPSGTWTGVPSMRRVTVPSAGEGGVPWSISWIRDMMTSYPPTGSPNSLARAGGSRPTRRSAGGDGRASCGLEVLRKVADGAHHRVGRESAQGAERAELQRLTEIRDQGQLSGAIALAAQQAIDHLGAANRADAAGGALAARL